MSVLAEWVADVCGELELDLVDQEATTTLVLDLTAAVAHGVARPAAPVTAFLVGLAAGRADSPDAVVAQLCRALGERARAYEAPRSE